MIIWKNREERMLRGQAQAVHPNPGDFLPVPASASLPLVEPKLFLPEEGSDLNCNIKFILHIWFQCSVRQIFVCLPVLI